MTDRLLNIPDSCRSEGTDLSPIDERGGEKNQIPSHGLTTHLSYAQTKCVIGQTVVGIFAIINSHGTIPVPKTLFSYGRHYLERC